MRVRTAIWAFGAGVGVWALGGVASAEATVLPAPLQALAKAHEAAEQRWRDADRRADDLAGQIGSLRRDRPSDRAALAAALEASLRREEALYAAEAARRAAHGAYQAGLDAEIRRLDAAMRALAPGLRTGPKAERQAVARRLAQQLRDRRALAAIRRDLSADRPLAPGSDEALSMSPMDGPDALREKADYAEDTRDKLAAERRRLKAALVAAEERVRLGAAEADLFESSAMFDDDLRTGRVLRQTAGASLQSPAAPQAAGAGAPARVEDDRGPQSPPAESTAGDFSVGEGRGDPAPTRDEAAPPTTAPEVAPARGLAPAAGPRGAPLLRQRTPQELLETGVGATGDRRSVADLLRRLGEVSKWESELSARARRMRIRAAALERLRQR